MVKIIEPEDNTFVPLKDPPVMGKSTKRFVLILLVLIVVVIGYIFISQTIQDDSVASQEVWDAELVKNQNERDVYAQGWAKLKDASFTEKKEYLNGLGARFDPDVEILKVGEETLYGNDLNYYMFLLQYDVYTSSKALTDADVDKGLSVLINHSLVLQKGKELGFANLDSSIYNNTEKDFTRRNEKVSELLPQVSKFFVDTVQAEVISIWFNNNIVPISVAKGKEIAEAKMNDLYNKLTSKQITMKQAGEIIANDPELVMKVDPNAKGNAYFSFNAELGGPPTFSDPEIEDQLWSLGEGQFSKVLIAKTQNVNGNALFSNKEIYFAIIKVNSRTLNKPYKTTEELYAKIPSDSVGKGETELLITKNGATPDIN